MANLACPFLFIDVNIFALLLALFIIVVIYNFRDVMWVFIFITIIILDWLSGRDPTASTIVESHNSWSFMLPG